MKIKNNEIDKIRTTTLTTNKLMEYNVKIVKISPTLNLNISFESDLINNNYIDDIKYDMDVVDTIDIEKTDTKDNFSNIQTPQLLEVVFFEELDNILKIDYHDLENINLEIKILNDKEEDVVLQDEIKQLKDELEAIIKKFEAIAKKYDFVYETLDYDKIREMNSYYIKYLIDDYKEALNNDELLDEKFQVIKDIEEYVNVLNTIIEIENKKDSLQAKVNEKLERFKIRDEKLERLKEDYYSIDKINDKIIDFNKSQAQTLNNLKQLIDKSVNIEKNVEYKKALSFNLNNALIGTLLMASVSFIPPTKKGNVLRVGLMIMGISKLSSIVKTDEKEKVTFNYDISSYEKEINSSLVGIKNVINDIDNALSDINFLRQKIKEEVGEYINEIPETKDLMKNINKIEKELTIQQEIAKNYSNEFSITLQENNEKIKKLDKYQN